MKNLTENDYRKLFGFTDDMELTDDMIKSSFRTLAKKYHPDYTHSDTNDQFRIIEDAYNFLLLHKSPIVNNNNTRFIIKNIKLTPKQAFNGCKIKISISNKKHYVIDIPPLSNNNTTIIKDIVKVNISVEYPVIVIPINIMDLLVGKKITIYNIYDTGKDYDVDIPMNTNPNNVYTFDGFIKCKFDVKMPSVGYLKKIKDAITSVPFDI